MTIGEGFNSNKFVGYLNSLQRLGAGNENSLAEFQACNSNFSHIHVKHPLTEKILQELQKKDGAHIILTGHAGDGKSTIALDVYKKLKSIPENEPLKEQLRVREEIENKSISIIKDLSERNKINDQFLIEELFSGERKFLLVTNTGTLLDLFKSQSDFLGLDKVTIESEILTKISDESGFGELIIKKGKFIFFNLARMDNLHIAKQIFEKMIDGERWTECEKNDCCNGDCPIFRNVCLIQDNKETVVDRLFLAYRRMYEYGARLTMRQITEHLSYCITSGLEETDVEEMRLKGCDYGTEFMFFNRFFGDNGSEEHAAAQEMQAIRQIKLQRYGERLCPTWERKLWLRTKIKNFSLNVENFEWEFDSLVASGSKQKVEDKPSIIRPENAREQVRRVLFFLYKFSDGDSYLSQYLNSPYILNWRNWQNNKKFTTKERNLLEGQVYHVLQEHFTGVRLSEGESRTDRRLYVTLGRRKNEVRQSAQVVLAQVDWGTAIKLELVEKENITGGSRTELFLLGLPPIDGIELKLNLPFLDYVIMRHFGELGEVLKTAYLERLERLKTQICTKVRTESKRIMLVRLKTDNTFRRQEYEVCNGKLEVSDVL
jgi:hypothetical protein